MSLARVDFPQYTHETGEEVIKETMETCFFMENRKLQFVVAKSLAVSHLLLEALPAVANYKRDHKTVVT